jgi:hypothetical protein
MQGGIAERRVRGRGTTSFSPCLHTSLSLPITADTENPNDDAITDNAISLGNSFNIISLALDGTGAADAAFAGNTRDTFGSAFAALHRNSVHCLHLHQLRSFPPPGEKSSVGNSTMMGMTYR